MLSPLGTQREDPILQLCLLLCLDVSKRQFLGEWTLYLPNLSPPHCSAKTLKDPRTHHHFTDRLAKKKLFCSNFCNLLHHHNNSKLSLNLQYFACMWLFLVMLHFLENMLETEQISQEHFDSWNKHHRWHIAKELSKGLNGIWWSWAKGLLSSQILNWGLYNWVEGKKKLYLHPLEHILKATNLRTYPKRMLGQSATCTTSA